MSVAVTCGLFISALVGGFVLGSFFGYSRGFEACDEKWLEANRRRRKNYFGGVNGRSNY